MRLLSTEHKKILEVVSDFDLLGELELIKKKGWVHIKIKEESFTFHRKKKTNLVNGVFVDHLEYSVQFDNENRQLNTFDEVANQLFKWLQKRV